MSMFLMPPRVYAGEGALEESADFIAKLGKKALIVTDRVMEKLGNIKKLTDALEGAGVDYAVYAEVNAEPTDEIAQAGAEAYKRNSCDFLIAIGGGSPIDTMKAIGVVAATGRHINSFLGQVIEVPLPPTVAIPTTAGTGSEATQFTIISNTKDDIKMLLRGATLMPGTAIVDPRFTVTAPPAITAATGVDALTHAIEAYTSRRANILSDTFALAAVRRVTRYLPAAFDTGADIQARQQMAIGALEAGIAFNNASVTIVHGMSRPIGALFHVPHGISNAMLLVRCLEFALAGAADRFCDLSKEVGLYEAGMTEREGGLAFVNAVGDLCAHLRIPTLEEYGIDRGDFFARIDKMTEDALASGSPGNTVRPVKSADIKRLYAELWS
ncbi:MAG: iron-containing alcohol dehydrogenase [Peptococcaceae bacterium]|nr:iron-containing alcohol dehydrogenase [Peptococcaceae bacterium]